MDKNKYPIGGFAPGNYKCGCCQCGGGFIGDKRAVECEPCAVAARQKFDAISPAEQGRVLKRNVEIYNEFVKNYCSND
jgi:hypothetical protein